MTVQKLAYTIEEASEQCGYSVGMLKQAVTDGNLVARYVKTTGVIRHEDLAVWIGQLPTKPNTGTSPVNDDRAVPNETDRPRTVGPKPTTPRKAQAPQLSAPESENELLTPKDVGHLLKLSPGTLSNWRSQRRGPEFKRIAGVVRYDPAVVEAWIKAQPSK